MNSIEIQALRTLWKTLAPFLGFIARREVLLAQAGLKPVRITPSEIDRVAVTNAITTAGLACIPALRSTWINSDKGKGGWSSAMAAEGEGAEFRHLYVATNQASANALRNAEESESPEKFGRELLIPSCCRHMFQRHAEAAASVQNDFFVYSFNSQEANCVIEVPWELNLGAQYFDSSLISHYPCSPLCEDSLRIARLAARIVGTIDPIAMKAAAHAMQMGTLYTEHHGVHLLPDPSRNKRGIRYSSDGVRSTGACPLQQALASGSLVTHDSSGNINVYENEKIFHVTSDMARILLPIVGNAR